MSAGHVFIFGNTKFDRKSLPDILADFEQLPTVDESAFAHRPEIKEAYKRNLEAYRLFVVEKDTPLRQIQTLTGINPKQLYRLLQRVLGKASDGRIEGLRGLIPFKHLKVYVREVVVKPTSVLFSKNASGAFGQLLRRYPSLDTWGRKKVRDRNRPLRSGEIREVKKSIRSLHREFLKKCIEQGVERDQYPFNQDLQGFRSFQAWVRRVTLEQKGSHSKAQDKAASVEPQPGQEFDLWPIGDVPFKLVQFDGHKLDVRLTLVVDDPFGMQTVIELHRIWILVVTDISTRCILGYYLALGPEYNKDDVAEAIQAAIVPHRRMHFTIAGLEMDEGGGFPNQVMPELEYHRFGWFHYDTAKSHIAHGSLERLTDVLGCWTMSGRLGEPDDRAIMERFFGLLEEHFHQLPGTTGSSPSDPVRKLADVGTDISRLISLDHLAELAEVVIGNLNGEVKSGLGGRTPLEAMRYQTSKPEFMIQTLPVSRRHQLFLLKEATIKTVRGKSIPHVNFECVRYTSDLLASRPELVGTTLRIYFIARDLRTIHAFFDDGSELGILVASRQWRKTPHSLRLRQEIFRLIRQGRLHLKSTDDPIEVYVREKRKEAAGSKRAANSVAKARAGITAANVAENYGDNAFGKALQGKTEQADAKTSVTSTDKKNKPLKPIVPVPLSLKRTLLF